MNLRGVGLLLVCCFLVACDVQPPDTEKPQLALSGEASRLTTNSQVTLEGKLAPDVVKFIYRLNGGEPTDITPTISNGGFKVVLDLPPGTNTIILEATDAAGNVTVSEPITLVVVDLNGVWGNLSAGFNFCDFSEDGNLLVLNLEHTPSSVTGTVTTGFGGDYKRGTLTGQVTEDNVLEAAVTFPPLLEGSPNRTGTLRYKIENGALTGELNYQDGQTCSENDETPATTIVSGTLTKGVDVPPLPPDDALEPNNDQSSATPVTLPYQSPSELILLRENPDWYRLELSRPSIVTLNLTTTQRLAGFTLRIYSETGLLGEPRYAFNVSAYQTAWGLAAGKYYLEVVGSPYFKEAATPYTFALRARAVPDATYEPNDMPETAYVIDTLPFDDDIYLQVNDEDWFRFTLPEPAVGQMNVLSFSGIVIPMTLYSAIPDRQNSFRLGEKLCADFDFFPPYPQNLPAGTYYLQVPGVGLDEEETSRRLAFTVVQEAILESPPVLCPQPEE